MEKSTLMSSTRGTILSGLRSFEGEKRGCFLGSVILISQGAQVAKDSPAPRGRCFFRNRGTLSCTFLPIQYTGRVPTGSFQSHGFKVITRVPNSATVYDEADM